VKQKVTSMMNPREPLTTIDHIIDRGRTTPASFVSSAMASCQLNGTHFFFWRKVNIHICAAESEPVNEMTAVRIPTSVDVPSLFHPPPLLKVVKTSFALARGARVQRGIRMAKKPAM
jgi:hypothetical protein